MTDHAAPFASSAEAAENAVLPRLREVHVDGAPADPAIPPALRRPASEKSAARWAYERLLLYIANFENRLGAGEEVAMGFAGGEAGVLRIEGIGYFDPDIVTFYGTGEDGLRTQLVQHVTQLNVLLRAVPVGAPENPARRIGFRLERELAEGGAAG